MPFCAECDEDDELCQHCGLCDQCCECTNGFSADELGLDPEFDDELLPRRKHEG